jgi:hypothetical protein
MCSNDANSFPKLADLAVEWPCLLMLASKRNTALAHPPTTGTAPGPPTPQITPHSTLVPYLSSHSHHFASRCLLLAVCFLPPASLPAALLPAAAVCFPLPCFLPLPAAPPPPCHPTACPFHSQKGIPHRSRRSACRTVCLCSLTSLNTYLHIMYLLTFSVS